MVAARHVAVVRIYDDLFALTRRERDPYLAALNTNQIDQVLAGRHYSAYVYAQERGDTRAANEAYEAFANRAACDTDHLRSGSRRFLN